MDNKMTYGSGTPPWGKGMTPGQQQRGKGGSGGPPPYQNQDSYQPPSMSGGGKGGTTYAEQQTQVMEDTMRTHYQAEGTAAEVLSQLTTQRYQLQGAHDNVWEMRQTTEKAKRELAALAAKTKQKKRRLQAIIVMLGLTDFLLFVRIVQCGGSFFCRRH